MIFETLKKLESQRKPMYIYKDEQTDQINEIPLSKLDSAGSALINKTVKQNPAKEIHKFMFGN
jgi:hypothetical protein